MEDTESKKIAAAWLNFQQNWWAWDKLDELCRKDPAGAWPVLMELVQQAQNAELLEDIGVGPLEDFLNYYATDYIEELEGAIQSNKPLKKALAYAQLRDPKHPLADRIEMLGCRISSAGKQTDAFDDAE
tara:strand:- start:166 stop:552 length:387 start_codon:yes stop_codon:yes gene_type:complete